MEHSSTRHGAQPTATNRPVPPTLEDISTFVAEIIRDNTFSRIMELVEGSQYYRNDLSEQDVLELIPRGLGLVQVEDGYWLCFQHRPTACPFPLPFPSPHQSRSMAPSVPRPPQEVGTSSQKHASDTGEASATT